MATDLALKTGRNEVTLKIDDINFHIIYDRSASNVTLAKSAEQRSRPLILLSHALMADSSMWDSTVEALGNEGWDCVRYDHLGHGATPVPDTQGRGGGGERKWTFDDFVGHMHEIVKAMEGMKTDKDEERARLRAVCGCSMGGVLAVRYAMRYGYGGSDDAETQREGRLGNNLKVVSIGGLGMKSLQESIPKWELRKEIYREQGVEVLARQTAERWFPSPVPSGVRERAEEKCKRCTLEGYERCSEGIVSYDYQSQGDLETLAQDQGVEVLVVRGEDDEAVGPKEILIELSRRIGARFVGMEGVGHLPPMHDSEAFEELLLGFLKH
jgi:3-oxoadipate enol-lactonase